MIHTIQCPKDDFEAILSRKKKFTIQKNDRDYRTGDMLGINETKERLGKEICTGTALLAQVKHVCRDDSHIPDGYVCLSIECLKFEFDGEYKLFLKSDRRAAGDDIVHMVSRDD